MASAGLSLRSRWSLALLAATGLTLAGCAARQPGSAADEVREVAWPVDGTEKIGGYPVERVGEPDLRKGEGGAALCFGGEGDAVVFPINPLDAQYDFTIQALVQVLPGGGEQQLILHLRDSGGEEGIQLETRAVDDENWALHSFVRSGTEKLDIENQEYSHKLGHWYWVALTYHQESEELRQYVNGVQVAQATLVRTPMKRGEMAIGTKLSRERWFKGCVRELRFATAALSPEKLASTED